MAERVPVGELASVIMESLEEYADLATEDMKKAVKNAGNAVKKEIRENAPKRTGAYGKSWAVKVSKETSNSLEVTVYSRNRYWLAHLLEFGHAKRGGRQGVREGAYRPGRGDGCQEAGNGDRKEPAGWIG